MPPCPRSVGRPPSRAVTAKYSEYAGLLASQGQLGGALDYLQAALPKPTREDEERSACSSDLSRAHTFVFSLILLDRIFRALPPIAGRTMAFPFQYTPIDADPYMQQAAAARQRMWQERVRFTSLDCPSFSVSPVPRSCCSGRSA